MCVCITDLLDSTPRPGQLSNHPGLPNADQNVGTPDAVISHRSLVLSIGMYQHCCISTTL